MVDVNMYDTDIICANIDVHFHFGNFIAYKKGIWAYRLTAEKILVLCSTKPR